MGLEKKQRSKKNSLYPIGINQKRSICCVSPPPGGGAVIPGLAVAVEGLRFGLQLFFPWLFDVFCWLLMVFSEDHDWFVCWLFWLLVFLFWLIAVIRFWWCLYCLWCFIDCVWLCLIAFDCWLNANDCFWMFVDCFCLCLIVFDFVWLFCVFVFDCVWLCLSVLYFLFIGFDCFRLLLNVFDCCLVLWVIYKLESIWKISMHKCCGICISDMM